MATTKQFDLGPEAADFRREVRAWISANASAGLRELADWNAIVPGEQGRQRIERASQHPDYLRFEERLLEDRWICAAWPEDVGGRALSPLQMAILSEEFYSDGLPRVGRGMGEWLVGPSIIAHGTQEQQRSFLPRIMDGSDRYCQGFSEPDHGSDLANVSTRGVIEGDEIVLYGQKVWTSGAYAANMLFVLCRTDIAAPKHRGLSYVLVPMEHNHIKVRPIRQLSGASEFCEEFLDGARAPSFNVIGDINDGWRVAMTTLGNERSGRTAVQHLAFARELWELVAALKERGRTTDPIVRQQLAWAYTQVELMRYHALRMLATMAADRDPGPQSSLTKLLWSEYHKAFGDMALGALGAESLLCPEDEGYHLSRWLETYLWSRAGTIYSGTSQIQRNIIAERVLGLPR